MGNSDNKGKGHWTDSSRVLQESERLRTRPMPRQPTTPTPSPFDVNTEQGHMSVTSGEGSMPLGGGFSVGMSGPNMHVGGKHTGSTTRLDGQVNVGGVSVSHTNDDHDYSFGMGLGWGGGVRVHHGEKPGFGGDVGPFSVDVRNKSFGKPMSEEAKEEMLKLHSPFGQ
ncbi:MAG: hypothetical protein ACTHU0_23420 [Kofleriaceae bacterium]